MARFFRSPNSEPFPWMLAKRTSPAPRECTTRSHADTTVDGPEIGTLVVVIDRARNLPSRRLLGKQNPYCIASLAKQTLKTPTDRKGGQAPKWDRELRFAVHESPKYFQLKLSIFSDDRKPDLIAESCLNLTPIIRTGGCKRDLWLSLGCSGKKAGEIRLDITYHDIKGSKSSAMPRRTRGHDENSLSNSAPIFRRGRPTASRPSAFGAREDGKISKAQRGPVQTETALDGSRPDRLATFGRPKKPASSPLAINEVAPRDNRAAVQQRSQSLLNEVRNHGTCQTKRERGPALPTGLPCRLNRRDNLSSRSSKRLVSLRSRILYWQNNVLSQAQRDELNRPASPSCHDPDRRSSRPIDVNSSWEDGRNERKSRDAALLKPLVPPVAKTPPPPPTHRHHPVAASPPGQPDRICTIRNPSPFEADGLGLIPAPLSFAAKNQGDKSSAQRGRQPKPSSGNPSLIGPPRQQAAWRRSHTKPRSMEKQGSLLFSSAKRAEQRMHNRSPLVRHQQKKLPPLAASTLSTGLELRVANSSGRCIEEMSSSSCHGESTSRGSNLIVDNEDDDDNSPPTSPSFASGFPLLLKDKDRDEFLDERPATDSLAPNESASNRVSATPSSGRSLSPQSNIERTPTVSSPTRHQPLVPFSATRPPHVRPPAAAGTLFESQTTPKRKPELLQLAPPQDSQPRPHPSPCLQSPTASPSFSIVKDRVQRLEASPNSKPFFPSDISIPRPHRATTATTKAKTPDKRPTSPSRRPYLQSSPATPAPASAFTTPVQLKSDQPTTAAPRPSPVSPLRSSMEVETALQRINEVEMAICKLREIASAASPPLQQWNNKQLVRAPCSCSPSLSSGSGGGGLGASPTLRKSRCADDAMCDRPLGEQRTGPPRFNPDIGTQDDVGRWKASERDDPSGIKANFPSNSSVFPQSSRAWLSSMEDSRATHHSHDSPLLPPASHYNLPRRLDFHSISPGPNEDSSHKHDEPLKSVEEPPSTALIPSFRTTPPSPSPSSLSSSSSEHDYGSSSAHFTDGNRWYPMETEPQPQYPCVDANRLTVPVTSTPLQTEAVKESPDNDPTVAADAWGSSSSSSSSSSSYSDSSCGYNDSNHDHDGDGDENENGSDDDDGPWALAFL